MARMSSFRLRSPLLKRRGAAPGQPRRGFAVIVSAGLPQLLRQLLRALSLNLSDSRKAIRSLYYYFGLGWFVKHAA